MGAFPPAIYVRSEFLYGTHCFEEIYQNILNYYDYLVDNWQNNDIKQSLHYEYMNNLYRRTGYHNYSTPEGEHFRAEIEDIGPQGHLTLRLESGEQRIFAFKEVIFI